ncbi:MAG: CDGSH iron-sulfur domain-containing protein [Nitrospirae bacterium]|nr:CDGSH iron-sulfur domain-containing protein [Nitrospirota bacterium]
MEKTVVKCFKNGPYEIQGDVEITDANGKKVSQDGSGTYHLCRCGGSSKKPFCDGTHSRLHFKSE